jgi:hypothetical protein
MTPILATLARLVGALAFATAGAAAHADTFSRSNTGSFALDTDLASIDFTLTTSSDLRAWTTSAAVSFDTLLSLFSLDTGALLAFGDDVDNPFPSVAPGQGALDAGVMLGDLGPGSYRLVLSVSPNLPSGAFLADGYTLDGTLGTTLGAGAWATELTAVDALPVPEPETWAILAAGLALAGAVRRRRTAAAADPA